MEVRIQMFEDLKNKAQKQHSEVVELRRFFHMHPEVAWKEENTTKKVAALLRDYGCENIRKGFGNTSCGVTAEIVGTSSGPCVALRADMDALPLQEENKVEYKSQNPGVMHACGHDAHTAMLLGAAKVLSGMKDSLKGKVRLIFQPAEEHGLISGADHMIKEGVLEGVDVICGLHVWSPLQSGKIAVRSGPFMAACDAWEAEIRGKGGHGSAPHMAEDPTIPASHVILALQSIVGRDVDPLETAVISTGKIQAGSAFNIIPERIQLLGTCRSFNPKIQDEIEEKIGSIVNGIAGSFQCSAEYKYTRYVPPTINDPKAADLVRNIAEKVAGKENVETAEMVMGSEDFSYYQKEVPGVFFFLGTGNQDKGTDNPHHSPRFNVDEDVLASGVQMLAGFALSWGELS
jgi:amidohydrolase